MKLVRYGQPGQEKPGLIDAQGALRDLSGVVADIDTAAIAPAELARLAKLDPASLPRVDGAVRYGCPVNGVGKIVCVGLNYADHAAESGLPVPAEPVLFLKPSSSLSGPNDPVIIPRGSVKTDWEVELGVVIGKKASYVEESEAMDYVAGYTVVNDVSEREYQIERGGQWDKGKGCDTFAPVGPWLVTRDEVADPQNLDMWLEVNGHRFQNGSTRTMVFGVKTLVSYISRFMSLMPGDIISTGTPPGVGLGQKPPVYLKAGDEMRLGIAGLGEQRQALRAWSRAE
ncbi:MULTISPECIES: fumarylacetoacetate hydrolase family protein [Achromobacter]|uniref:Ureidoglycolate lyase n=1 Tax=Achromobacter ruhlandii TaxID=72557 RepID=A0ABM8M327_9BURK|nr:fumarylacetoacetate hydrolase family protein [Achromobacter ruhlandii]AKP89738.1 5-carboxymethyl-2-hydroxymuconate delta-isomerase [Achromobacter xylosoxidans]AOU92593.1 2-hydroxyhepta-2,4-diene-1,7-dioate isomerase/5-carboxymethyl-2-oxo-hex-3- ene-1,7-dioate decarboxylase [Achromobacter ruhlandii]MCZ8395220.1 fumarylacetoacetate hydrolase family protein [Achromobacter ruhlandii]MCZ8430893.1 fumarylacetoacetate hydrolase family protein [Achromobacter ruhlandii]MDC6087756.1 fumarylacetoaceta